MATALVPEGGITLKGYGEHGGKDRRETTALLVNLNGELVQDIRRAAKAKDGLRFVTGGSPKLRIGGRTIDLNLHAVAFRNELFASTVAGSLANLTYSGSISHRAVLKTRSSSPENGDTGSDEALAALQNSMAAYEQEKQASQTSIHNVVLGEKARKQHRRMLSSDSAFGASSPAHTPRHGPAPTSAYNGGSDVKVQAMKTALVHLLAVKPLASEDITRKTHIPASELEGLLPKVARKVDGAWLMVDKAYKDLDIWNFGYTSHEDRKLAIDNAIRAYDRQRIGTEDKIWQNLHSKEERGKGIILSRLHQAGRGLTPNHFSEAEDRPASAAGTPRVGASTPRPANPKNDPMKRLLAGRDPKKRAAEEAKEKKRKEKEVAKDAAASDRESTKRAKTQVKKKVDPKVKSAETVHSSDDESGEEGEVKEGDLSRVDSKVSLKPRPAGATPRDGHDTPKSGGANSKKPADVAKSIASLASKTAMPTGKATPCTNNGLWAPSSQHKSARSPSAGTRPNVPSPLGAARPRVASDVSDRDAIGVQRARSGAGTPQGLGIIHENGGRKRNDTITSTDSAVSSASDRKPNGVQKPNALSNGTPKAAVNGVKSTQATGVKRKPDESASAEPAAKHRKTTSNSSGDTQPSHTSSTVPRQSTSQTSPDTTFNSESSDSASSMLEMINYNQGVNLAEKFRDLYYPAYAAMYDAQVAQEARGEKVSKGDRERLWEMHKRLEVMKREIASAAEREHRED